MRQRYWIIGGRSTIRHYIYKCLNCFRLKRIKQQQLMGSLPEKRLHPSRPFLHCGVDYAGPIKIRLNKGRGAKTSKGYIALYVCFSTKAIHVEMVSDLTTDAFIASLKRFISRRGIPAGIYSDNGTNFIGAKRKLSELYKMVLSTDFNNIISTFLSKNECQWHFIPPVSPHFGGLWESGVKAVKTHLKRVIGDAVLTFEEMATLLTQIEGILNSRPISQISDSDTSSLDPLTPGHFLIGTAITALPEKSLLETNPQRLNRWQQIQRIVQSYWKQWSRDYLHELNQRPKWRKEHKNVAVDDLVLVHEDNLPPTAWLLGRITEVHPGKDEMVRAVTLRTKL
ncbi:uncharacterized protein LOC129947450 [Eupeodes corollae]|uniref:uncharacterized protein LOC129947450 n=1 Tax=Eupeodes corollae TaxID=290404 RepID=UPI00249071FD|nr:uncharacterized protein LOC129947450 [Eupeodes corollae]